MHLVGFRIRWAGHVACMGEKRGVYRILVGKPEGRRPRRRWVDTGLREESGFPDPADRKLSANLYDTYHCCVYSEELLMMDRGTARNM